MTLYPKHMNAIFGLELTFRKLGLITIDGYYESVYTRRMEKYWRHYGE